MWSLKLEIWGMCHHGRIYIVFTKISLTQLIESLMTILKGDQRNQSLDFFHFDVKWRSSSFPAAGAGK